MSSSIRRRTFLRTLAAAAVGSSARGRLAFGDDGEARSPLDVPVVDTHLHLWDLTRLNLPWLKSASPTLNKTFRVEDFRKAADGLNVTKAVYMEVDVHPSQQAEEAAFAIALCRDKAGPLAGAVIGGYPHQKGFADYLKEFADEPRVKGVRTILHAADRPRGLCLEPAFVESMRRLGDAGLTFDLCMRPDELLDGVKLAGLALKTTFVLDHCGNIGLDCADPARQVWLEGVKAAAERPNVVCKISGLIDKARPQGWTAADIAEAIGPCLDAFGEDRVLFGGDWPVCLTGGSYRDWVTGLAAAVADRSPEFRRKLFHDNAVRVYRL